MALELSTLEVFYGSFTLLSVIISTILGILIAVKYTKFRKRDFLVVGITWILLISPYWPDAIQFLIGIIFSEELDSILYFFLANIFIAPIHITWVIAFTDFLFKRQQKKILAFFATEAIIYEILLLTIFFLNPTLIGERKSAFVVEWAIWIQIYLLFSIALFLVTGFLFARKSMKAEDSQLKLKGRFLLIAFITFTIGTVIDVVGADNPTEITILLARTFVIISAICFYIGYTLPKFIKELFIRE